ncbi:MAG: hypothetical protein K2K80_00575 [Clostridia bacterium]|nr:hypothetical protein [Clostridia bacterium]
MKCLEKPRFFSEAENEKRITTRDILEEVKVAIDELFVGDMVLTDNGILYSPLNGQKFKIKVLEM